MEESIFPLLNYNNKHPEIVSWIKSILKLSVQDVGQAICNKSLKQDQWYFLFLLESHAKCFTIFWPEFLLSDLPLGLLSDFDLITPLDSNSLITIQDRQKADHMQKANNNQDEHKIYRNQWIGIIYMQVCQSQNIQDKHKHKIVKRNHIICMCVILKREVTRNLFQIRSFSLHMDY